MRHTRSGTRSADLAPSNEQPSRTRSNTRVNERPSGVDNQTMQHVLASRQTPFIQRKCACGASSRSGERCEECEGSTVHTKLAVGSSTDPLETEADAVADHIMRMGRGPSVPPSIQAARGASHALRSPKQAHKSTEKSVSSETRAADATEGAQRLTQQAGSPLSPGLRAFYEPRFGRDFSSVRLHTGVDAATAARDLHARAFTVGGNIAFGAGELQPHSEEGQRLLAHELTHVVQQQGGAGNKLISRQPISTAEPSAAEAGRGGSTAPTEHAADSTARDAGPCAVQEGTLTNAGLLFQLNRARVFVTQHDPHREGSSDSESDYYDYHNLLRRLSAERRRRVAGGHVWLAEPQQIAPPEQVYALLPGDALAVEVNCVAGSAVGGEFAATATTYLSRAQFERFLAQHNIPTIQADSLLSGEGRDRAPGESATLDLPHRIAQRWMLASQPETFHPFGVAAPSAFDPYAAITPLLWRGGADAFGLNPLSGGSTWNARSLGLPYRREDYVPLASETVGDLRRAPSGISSSLPEVLFMPAPPPRSVGESGELGGPYDWNTPTGEGVLGSLARPGAMPDGTTGFMWEGSHVTDMTFLHGRPVSRGFRAPLGMHMIDTLTSHRSRATAELNVGTPGSYANDWLFPYAGEAWGRSTSHWRQGSVMIVNADGSPVSAAQLIEVMGANTARLEGTEYRFSPPPEGSSAFRDADAEARRRGLPAFCPAGASNCENIPFDIHRRAAGGGDLSYTDPTGRVVSIGNPEDASGRRMSELMNQPPEFWAARGMRRVNLGPRMYSSLALGTGMGVGAQLWSDYGRMSAGEEVAWGRNAALAGGFNIAQTFAEEAAHSALTTRLATPLAEGGMGLSGSRAALASRTAASTSVAVVAAPALTGTLMAVDPYQDYTNAEYAGSMGRTVLPAAGSALAMVAYGAGVGSVGGPVGVIVGAGGVVLGLVVYSTIDWLTGDAIEGSIREGMGVRGCSGE